MKLYTCLLTSLLFFSGGHSNLLAEDAEYPGLDWHCFLGPEGNGISAEKNLLETWPEAGPNLIWKHKVGTGYSSPSIRAGKLVIHYREGRQEVLECLNPISSKQLWKHAYPSDYRDPYGYNNGPRCSPFLSPDHSFTLGAEGKLTCLLLKDGSQVWQRDLDKEYEVPEHFFGFGCSPILDGEKLYVLVGGQPNAGVVCFDAKTGKTLWEHVGEETWQGVKTGWKNKPEFEWTKDEMIVSYASPVIAEIHGKKLLIALMRHGLVGLDTTSGKEQFKYFFRSKVNESVNASRPVVLGNKIFISSAYEMGGRLLEVAADGKTLNVLWSKPEIDMHWSTAIEHGGYLYGFCGRHENEAVLRCVELKTGETLWSTNGYEGPVTRYKLDENKRMIDTTTGKVAPFPYFGRGSLTLVDGKFIVFGERGTVALVKPDPQSYQELSRFKAEGIEYPSWPAPVVSHGILYLRGEENLVAYDLRKH